jgi:hypothetical protein
MIQPSEVGKRIGDAFAVLRAMFARQASAPQRLVERDRRVEHQTRRS